MIEPGGRQSGLSRAVLASSFASLVDDDSGDFHGAQRIRRVRHRTELEWRGRVAFDTTMLATDGLTEIEARRRLATEGPNELPVSGPRGSLRLLRDVVVEPMFLLLVVCGAIYMALGDRREALCTCPSSDCRSCRWRWAGRCC
jgi:Cation transporter/ATPase, N-terminus